MNKTLRWLCFAASLFLMVSCKQHYTPKPYVYFRIDLPNKEYKHFTDSTRYSFDVPTYAFVISDSINNNWSNVEFPLNRATVYITYKALNNDFSRCMEESREFVYKHTVKADAIKENYYFDDDKKVYGILYDIKGNAASPIQFFITDSTRHFLRGSLYFSCSPNKDSLAPVVDFLREDIVRLIESMEWY